MDTEPCSRSGEHPAHTWTTTRGSYPPVSKTVWCPGK